MERNWRIFDIPICEVTDCIYYLEPLTRCTVHGRSCRYFVHMQNFRKHDDNCQFAKQMKVYKMHKMLKGE